MNYIIYDKNKPFNTTVVSYDSELDAIMSGAISVGDYEIELINARQALWFKGKLTLTKEARKELLYAFDRYKSNVQYGIEQETDTQHSVITAWYQSLLDLADDAFINVPECIKYYIQ